MHRAARNAGVPGVVAMAVSAVDTALWDLKARLLDLPLARLLGTVRDDAAVYGSGGFTTDDVATTCAQLTGWLERGFDQVTIKIGESWGTRVGRDLHRTRLTRDVVGPGVALHVDANAGYTAKQAVRVGRELDALGVVWFEEPVSSDDRDGLRLARSAVDFDVTAGEYAARLSDVALLCAAGAVDCLQLDASRCGGVTDHGAAVSPGPVSRGRAAAVPRPPARPSS